MSKLKRAGAKVSSFMTGKGFYIVLILCLAVIGVSVWAMLSVSMGGDGSDYVISSGDETISTPHVAVTPSGRPASAGTDSSADTDTSTRDVEASPPAVAATDDYLREAVDEALNAGEALETAGEEAQAVASYETEVLAAASATFIRPLNGEVVSYFAMSELVFNRTMQDWRTHNGIDLAAELGTQVKAISSGTIIEISDNDMMGTTVTVDHSNGLYSQYSNLAAVPTVSEGQYVGVGEVIGAVGDTALAETGEAYHLHLSMMLNGVYVDPLEYLPE